MISVEAGEHLFRREAGRLVAALTRLFGVHNLALAEDVVQDALCRALEVWKFRGMPENPAAWLMATAKNRHWMSFGENGVPGRTPRSWGGCWNPNGPWPRWSTSCSAGRPSRRSNCG